jgi:hypothetical protein
MQKKKDADRKIFYGLSQAVSFLGASCRQEDSLAGQEFGNLTRQEKYLDARKIHQ